MAGIDLERGSAVVSLLLVAVVAAAALWVTAPPGPVAASAAATEFSAERAMAHVDAVAKEIHPIGSAAHQRARDYVLDQLRAMGLEPEVQTAWAGQASGGTVVQARVENVLARIEGDGGAGTLALVSHYDSVPTGPGAGDAAAGTAAILETVRALLAGDSLQNDLIVLITDGEEVGLLGARAFVAEHPWFAEIDLVLNFEARGNRGPVTMFETSAGNGRLARELENAAPAPWASSLSYEVYRRMPNDTDFTVLREAGVAGLNFAMIGNHSAYHTELDTPEALDRSSLQHFGSYALALTRQFGNLDLGDLAAPDAVFFNPFRFQLVVYPVSLARWMAVGTMLVLLAVIVVGVRRNALDRASVLRGALAGVGVPLVCALILGAGWNLLERVFPAVVAAPHGDPYAAGTILLAFLLLSTGLTAFVAGMLEESRSGSLRAGALALWAAIAVALAYSVPGASYLTFWPALIGAVALAVMVASSRRVREQSVGLAIVAPVVVAAIFAPIVRLVGEGLTVTAAPIIGFVIGLPLAFLLPELKEMLAGRLFVPVACVLAGLGMLAWIGWSAAPGALTPRMTSLYYALDSEKEEAWFVSYETEPDDWTRQVFPADLEAGPLPEFLPGRLEARGLSIAAPVKELSAPSAELVSDVLEGNTRTITVRVRSPRGAPWIRLVPDASMAMIEAMGVVGQLLEIDGSASPTVLMLQGVPAEGVEVAFRMEGRQPFALGVLDASFGLPEFEGLTIEPRPGQMMRSTHWLSDTTNVYRQVWF